MENVRIPGNDRLSKKFYEVFWDDVKFPLLASSNEAFIKKGLSTSQKTSGKKINSKISTETKYLLRSGDQYPC